MTLKKRALLFAFVYLSVALGKGITEIPSSDWSNIHSFGQGLGMVWDKFRLIANQLLGGVTSAGVLAFVGFGKSNDTRSPSSRAAEPMEPSKQNDVERITGIFYRGTFYPEKIVLETIGKLNARVRELADKESSVRQQAEGILFRISRLEMFRWSLFCLCAAIFANPISAVVELVVQRLTDPHTFVHVYAQSLCLECLALVAGWIVAKCYYNASGDRGYSAAIVIPAVGFGFSGLGLVLGITGSPDLSEAASAINGIHLDQNFTTTLMEVLIVVRVIILPLTAILASVVRRYTLAATS